MKPNHMCYLLEVCGQMTTIFGFVCYFEILIFQFAHFDVLMAEKNYKSASEILVELYVNAKLCNKLDFRRRILLYCLNWSNVS